MNVEVSPRKQHYLHSMTILKGLANSKNLNSFYLVPFYKLHWKKQHENIIVVLNSHFYIYWLNSSFCMIITFTKKGYASHKCKNYRYVM